MKKEDNFLYIYRSKYDGRQYIGPENRQEALREFEISRAYLNKIVELKGDINAFEAWQKEPEFDKKGKKK